MPEEKKEVENIDNPMQEDYLAKIDELKKNSVSKDDYNKLYEENKKLLASFVDGTYEKKEEVKDELKESSVYKRDIERAVTNLDFVTATLNYHDAVLKEDNINIFCQGGVTVDKVDPEELEAAQKLEDILKQCVEDCDHDSNVFDSLIQKHFIDQKNSFR